MQSYTRYKHQRSVCLKDRVETNGWTDGQTDTQADIQLQAKDELQKK